MTLLYLSSTTLFNASVSKGAASTIFTPADAPPTELSRLAGTVKPVSVLQLNTFTDRSKAVLLLWIIFVVSVMLCYVFMHVCLLMPCGHLPGKG